MGLWFELIAVSGYTLLAFSLFQLLIKMAHNYKAQQFWKQKCPNVNVPAETSIFHGHAHRFVYTSRNWKKLDEAMKSLGKFFGAYYFDKQVIFTSDLDFIKQYAINEANNHNEKPLFAVPLKELQTDNVAFTKGEQWKKLRKITSMAVSPLRFRTPIVQGEMNDVVEEFCTALDHRINKAKMEHGENFIEPSVDDMSHRFAFATLFSCFYKQKGVIDFEAETDFFSHKTCVSMREFANLMASPLKLNTIMHPILKPLIKYLIPFTSYGQLISYIMDLVKKQTRLHFDARKHLQKAREAGVEINPDDFVLKDGRRFQRNMSDYVIDHFQDGRLSETEYLHSMFLLFFASEITTADAISKIIYHLAVHQDVQAKLRQSIMAEGVNSEYMQWVLFESMRLFPPVQFGATRILGRDVPTKAGLIPAETYVLTPAYTIHRSKEYWGEDADEFKPERWREAKSFHQAQYLAFGLGKRVCPGREMAIHEMRKLFHALLQRFKFETCAKTTDPNEFEAPIFFLTVPDLPNHIRISRL